MAAHLALWLRAQTGPQGIQTLHSSGSTPSARRSSSANHVPFLCLPRPSSLQAPDWPLCRLREPQLPHKADSGDPCGLSPSPCLHGERASNCSMPPSAALLGSPKLTPAFPQDALPTQTWARPCGALSLRLPPEPPPCSRCLCHSPTAKTLHLNCPSELHLGSRPRYQSRNQAIAPFPVGVLGPVLNPKL